MNARSRWKKSASMLVIATLFVANVLPAEVVHAGVASDDLKQIEYRYYFRGKYQQSIEALQTFLARVDLTPAETTRAREFLAASYVLGGAPAMGREVFTRIIVADPAYAGPDPAVFKLDVMNAYAGARADHAALTLKQAPPTAADALVADTPAGPALEKKGKPVYRQWWFYAGAAVVAAVAVGATAAGGDESAAPPSGTLVVGVRIR